MVRFLQHRIETEEAMANLSSSALFDQYADARAALAELRRHFGFRKSGLVVTVRSVNAPSAELRIEETDLRSAVFKGALWGALGGLLATGLGVFISEEEGWIPPDVSTIVFSCFAGLIIGLISGALVGPSNPKWELEQLQSIAHDQGVVITVSAKKQSDRAAAQRILKRHAGHLPPPALAIHGPHPA
jgi:hypothetical protein